METWKILENWPRYEVSNFGRVRIGSGRQTHLVLVLRLNKRGYPSIKLSDGKGKRTHVDVHRLVAIAFLPKPDNKPYVNHIDGNKTNNAAINLEWCSAQENVLHAHKMGLVTTKNGGPLHLIEGSIKQRKLNADQVREIRTLHKTGVHLIKDLAKKFGLATSATRRLIIGESYRDVN